MWGLPSSLASAWFSRLSIYLLTSFLLLIFITLWTTLRFQVFHLDLFILPFLLQDALDEDVCYVDVLLS